MAGGRARDAAAEAAAVGLEAGEAAADDPVAMVVHVVFFRPHAGLAESARRDLLERLKNAADRIPSVRRFRVGRRLLHGLPGYEQAMREAFDYAAIVEFDDRDGLISYLAHPAHEGIGAHFTASAEASLAYDFEMIDARDAGQLDHA